MIENAVHLDVAGVIAAIATAAPSFDAFTLQLDVPGDASEAVGAVSALDAVVVAASALGTVGVVRWLVKRAAPSFVVTESTTTASVSSTASLSGATVKKSDVAFTLPAFLPVSKGIRKVTHDEIHALELGLLVGLFSTWLYDAGHPKLTATIFVVFIAGSLGFKRYSSKAFRTTRHEPWYALGALLVGCSIAYGLFVADPTVLELVGVA